MFQRFSTEKTDSGLDFDIEVEPGKRVYCFFGRNGAGKTSWLENLGRTLPHSVFVRDEDSNEPSRQQIPTATLTEGLAARPVMNPDAPFGHSNARSFEVATLLRFMEELDPKLFAGISARAPDGSFQGMHDSDGRASLGGSPLGNLPSGFRAIVALLQKILSSFRSRTPPLNAMDLSTFDGIVLVDDIEAHQHPTWQARIVPLLKRFFPQATFYLCTHSPLIVATTDDGEAYELVREDQRKPSRLVHGRPLRTGLPRRAARRRRRRERP